VAVHLVNRLLPPLRPSAQPTFAWSRVEAFIDGLYAIAATLLVLELKPPRTAPGHLGHALLDQWPIYLVYALGFIQMIGGWAASRRLGSMLARADHYVVLMTMVALMSFVLTPFTFAVLSDAVHDRHDFVSGIRLLSLVLSASLIGLAGNMTYIRRRGYFREGLHAEAFERAYLASVTVWVLPLLALGLSYVVGPWAITPIVVMSALSLLPFDLPGDAAL
jgi:uncharacterized membrane protein